jgi:hypothetical protein
MLAIVFPIYMDINVDDLSAHIISDAKIYIFDFVVCLCCWATHHSVIQTNFSPS